ncbi:MAG: hypothetical protein MUD01_26930, partial [Chloroflexaceae bacterium]|nr:hypothetical protein [Chloroflexaceae bacterium]
DSARPIFYAISQQRLGSAERKALDLIRAELHQYAGEYEAGLTDLERTDWADVSETSARLWMVRGEFQEELGFPDRALGSYGEGTEVITRLLGQLMGFRQRRGMLYYRRRDLKQSWQAVFRAEFDLELLRGLLREEEGAYDTALTTFSHLRTLADQLEDDGLRAMAERQLARVCGRREQLDDAIFHARHALEIYERVGDRVNLEKMRSNLSSIYVQTRQFEQALAVGQQAHAFFVAAHNPHFAATTAANMAEAAYGLGDLAAAEGYANEVVRLDQPFATHYARFTLGQVALARHEPAVAMQHLNESLRLAEQNGDLYMVAYAQRALGQALAASGERASAHESISNALARFRELNIPSEIAATEQLLAEQT